MPYYPLYVLIVILAICAFVYFILFTITMLKFRVMKKHIDILIENHNCFSIKVIYDGMLLNKARDILVNNNIPFEKRREILELLAYCQQSISCDSIVHEMKKLNKEEVPS